MTSLTIILPTYNGQAYLARQIDSILEQSDPDFLLLTMDDGSTDATTAIIEDYMARDGRVRRLSSTGNLGQRVRLRQLAEAASTEFVAIADQDDVWHAERNAKLLSAIGNRALAFGRSQLIDADGNDLGTSILQALRIDPMTSGPLQSLFRPLISAHAAIIRRDWLDLRAFSSFDPFDVTIGREALLSIGLIYIDDAIVCHRIHGKNQMNGSVIERRSNALLSRHKWLTNFSFVKFDRLMLFLTLDQLGRSMALEADTRSVFARAALACLFGWFQPLNFKFGKGRRLERELHVQLDQFAGSDADFAYFNRRVRTLTRPQLSPVNIAESVRRQLGHDA